MKKHNAHKQEGGSSASTLLAYKPHTTHTSYNSDPSYTSEIHTPQRATGIHSVPQSQTSKPVGIHSVPPTKGCTPLKCLTRPSSVKSTGRVPLARKQRDKLLNNTLVDCISGSGRANSLGQQYCDVVGISLGGYRPGNVPRSTSTPVALDATRPTQTVDREMLGFENLGDKLVRSPVSSLHLKLVRGM